MKVLQVNDFYEKGGAEMVMRRLGEAMTLRGHEVHFAVGDGLPGEKVHRIRHLKGMSSLLLRRLIFFNTDPIAYRDFEVVVRKIKPDIIHCHNLVSCISLETVKVALKYKTPLVVSMHDYWSVCLNRTLLKGSERKPRLLSICNEIGWDRCTRDCKWATFKKAPSIKQGMLKRMRLLSSDNVKIVAVSKYIKKVLERFGYVSDGIKVIYNGVDSVMFSPKKSCRQKMVLYLGGGNWRLKGLNHFIAMAKKIRMNMHDARFVVLGGKIANLPNFIENPGKAPFSDLVDYYQNALCVCMPSLWPEPFPLVALESMACATPVVAYASGGLTECIKNGETGFVVERNNLNKMTRKVFWLLDNQDSARIIGLRARGVIEESYTLDKMCDQYESLYCKIANEWSL